MITVNRFHDKVLDVMKTTSLRMFSDDSGGQSGSGA